MKREFAGQIRGRKCNHVYYTNHSDIVSYPLVALCEIIVTLLDSSVSFFLLFVDGVPMLVFATWIN